MTIRCGWSFAQGAAFILKVVALVFLTLYGVMFIQHAVAVVGFPYQMDYGEGLEIYAVARLLSGQPLYGDITQPPYHTLEYPPLYTLVVSPIALLIGIQYAAGRVVSVALALIVAWQLARLVYQETRVLWASLATGLLWLTSHLVYNWAVLMREDMLSLAFSLLGLGLFWQGYIRLRRERYVFVAMVLFVTAAYSRATAVWAAAASLTCLALMRRWKLAGQALALYAGLGLTILGLMQMVTTGEFFRHLVLYNIQSWELDKWMAALERTWRMYPFAILAGMLTLGLAILRRWPALPALYLAFAWLSTWTTGKHGAYINHLLEASVATWLACGLLLGRASQSKQVWWPLIASIVLLLQTVRLIHLPYSLQSGTWPPWTVIKPAVKQWAWYKSNHPLYLWTPADSDRQAADELDQRVRQTPGLILSEDGSFTATHGRPMWIQFQPFRELARDGRWDQTEFLNQIYNRQFALILLQFDLGSDARASRLGRMTPEMLEALAQSYVLEKQIWLYYVYTPPPAPAN